MSKSPSSSLARSALDFSKARACTSQLTIVPPPAAASDLSKKSVSHPFPQVASSTRSPASMTEAQYGCAISLWGWSTTVSRTGFPFHCLPRLKLPAADAVGCAARRLDARISPLGVESRECFERGEQPTPPTRIPLAPCNPTRAPVDAAEIGPVTKPCTCSIPSKRDRQCRQPLRITLTLFEPRTHERGGRKSDSQCRTVGRRCRGRIMRNEIRVPFFFAPTPANLPSKTY